MTPRGRWPSPPDGDNTPQGKLAHGCMWLIVWVVIMVVVGGLANMAEHYFFPEHFVGRQ